MRARHRAYFLALAEEAEPLLFGPDQAGWLHRLESEHDNLCAAIEAGSALQTDALPQAGLRLCAALWRFWEMRGYFSEGRGATGDRTDCQPGAHRDSRAPSTGRDGWLCLRATTDRLEIERALEIAAR